MQFTMPECLPGRRDHTKDNREETQGNQGMFVIGLEKNTEKHYSNYSQ